LSYFGDGVVHCTVTAHLAKISALGLIAREWDAAKTDSMPAGIFSQTLRGDHYADHRHVLMQTAPARSGTTTNLFIWDATKREKIPVAVDRSAKLKKCRAHTGGYDAAVLMISCSCRRDASILIKFLDAVRQSWLRVRREKLPTESLTEAVTS